MSLKKTITSLYHLKKGVQVQGFAKYCNMEIEHREEKNYRKSFPFAVLLLFSVFLCKKARSYSPFHILKSVRR